MTYIKILIRFPTLLGSVKIQSGEFRIYFAIGFGISGILGELVGIT